MTTVVSSIPSQCTRNVVGNEGNKVTEIIFTRSREFTVLMDSGEIISQSSEPRTVTGVELNTYRVFPLSSFTTSPLFSVWLQLLENLQS
jgi:hypothetical protein